MTAGGASIPEVQRLLAVLAAGRRVAEAGTAFGDGAAAMAETAASVVTVESDPERASVAAARLRGLANVELLAGDWREELPPRAPFDLLFLDSGGWRDDPFEKAPLAVELLAPAGLLVVDDMAAVPWENDPVRDFLFGHRELVAADLLVTPEMRVLVAAKR